ncbi:MAG TPA: arginase [Fimbriimonas sp.]|nr:arginase [Fimbriimonas sp.]
MAIEVHGAAYDLGGARQGSRLGPDALRLAGLFPRIASVVHEAPIDLGNTSVDLNAQPGNGLPYVGPVSAMLQKLRLTTAEILDRGNFPIMLGGEHSLSAGPLAAMLEKYGSKLGIMWIDAHADINTPCVSHSMNVHGMPLALSCGMPSCMDGIIDEHWQSLLNVVGPHFTSTQNIAWFGLRDVDDGEIPRVKQGMAVTMHDIDRDGVLSSWERIHRYFINVGCEYLYISLDVDAMDPILAPGTGTAVRGGLTYREAHLLAELIYQTLATSSQIKLAGLDVVEVSPIHDTNNQTATVASEWVASLFGKGILS